MSLVHTIARRFIGRMACGAKLGSTIKQPFTVFIEGNIGSGKTTFLNHFERYDQVCLVTEPVEKWRDVGGVNLFQLMYDDPDRWAFPFQTYVTLTMLQSHNFETTKTVKLMERSLYSARNIFVENMLHQGTLKKGMYNVLQEWYDYISDNVHLQADLIVYLRSTPEVVYERMKKRGRSEESTISLEFLRHLHELHENWLIKKEKFCPAPVLVLDANLDLDNIDKEYKRSETSILKPILTEVSNQQALMPSPSKRFRSSFE